MSEERFFKKKMSLDAYDAMYNALARNKAFTRKQDLLCHLSRAYIMNRRNHHLITNTWKRSRTFFRAAKVYIDTTRLYHINKHRLDVWYDDGKCSRNECVQLGAGDNVDSLTHVCYVLGMSYGIDRKAPRSLQIICSFLNFGVVQSISKIIKKAKLYKENFCLLEVSLLNVTRIPVGHRGRGPPRPRRTGNPRHVAFMMSLESVNSSKQKSLDKELLKMNRSVMFVEDMERALREREEVTHLQSILPKKSTRLNTLQCHQM